MPDELCICGRYAHKVHCPQCGCATVRALASKQNWVTRPNGDTDILNVYRCRTCNNVFNDDDWKLRCNAPPPRSGSAPSTLKERVNPDVPDLTAQAPEDLMRAMAIAKRKNNIP